MTFLKGLLNWIVQKFGVFSFLTYLIWRSISFFYIKLFAVRKLDKKMGTPILSFLDLGNMLAVSVYDSHENLQPVFKDSGGATFYLDADRNYAIKIQVKQFAYMYNNRQVPKRIISSILRVFSAIVIMSGGAWVLIY